MPDKVPVVKGGVKVKKVPTVKPSISMAVVKKGTQAKKAVPKSHGVKPVARKSFGKRKPQGLSTKGRTKKFIPASNNSADSALAMMKSPEIYP